MDQEDYYLIKDLNSFVKETKKVAIENFKSFVKNEKNHKLVDEVTNKIIMQLSTKNKIEDNIVSDQECELIINPFLEKQNGKFVISEGVYFEILKSIHTRIVSNTLNVLSSKGIIESAYDEELNDFVFWLN